MARKFESSKNNNHKPLIELVGVSKVYQTIEKKGEPSAEVKAVDSVSLKIHSGEKIAIIGPSGSGKSTLMHLIGLLDTPTKGQILLEGRDVSKLSEGELARLRGQTIGFVFQSFNLLRRVPVLGQVLLPTVYNKISTNPQEKALGILKRLGLEDRLTSRPSQLSGGQQQRVAIARALVNDPVILLADEPTGNLDTKSGAEVLAILDDLNKEGKTVITVTHDQDIAGHARRIIRVVDGKVVSDERRGV